MKQSFSRRRFISGVVAAGTLAAGSQAVASRASNCNSRLTSRMSSKTNLWRWFGWMVKDCRQTGSNARTPQHVTTHAKSREVGF
jgi:hypothetical protein